MSFHAIQFNVITFNEKKKGKVKIYLNVIFHFLPVMSRMNVFLTLYKTAFSYM